MALEPLDAQFVLCTVYVLGIETYNDVFAEVGAGASVGREKPRNLLKDCFLW